MATSVHHCGPDWNISTAIGCIAMKSIEIHVMSPTGMPSSGQHFNSLVNDKITWDLEMVSLLCWDSCIAFRIVFASNYFVWSIETCTVYYIYILHCYVDPSTMVATSDLMLLSGCDSVWSSTGAELQGLTTCVLQVQCVHMRVCLLVFVCAFYAGVWVR